MSGENYDYSFIIALESLSALIMTEIEREVKKVESEMRPRYFGFLPRL